MRTPTMRARYGSGRIPQPAKANFRVEAPTILAAAIALDLPESGKSVHDNRKMTPVTANPTQS